MKSSAKNFKVASFFVVLMLVLSGCGSNSEAKLNTICDEANSALSILTTDEIVPGVSANWSEIQSIYSDISSKLQELSSQASEIGESQLARDFSSVGKNAGEIEAVASFIVTMGGGPAAMDNTIRSSWLDAVNKLTDNEALRAPNDRTFIGCKKN